MMKNLRTIAAWGIRPETPTHLVEHYRLTNLILLFMLVMSILQTILCFATGAIWTGFINLSAPFTFGGGLILMRAGHANIARIGVFAIVSTVGYEFLASVGPDSGFQYIFLFGSALAIGMFSSREKSLLAFGIAAPLACLLSLEVKGYKPLFIPEVAMPVTNHEVMRIASLMFVWVTMVVYFRYFVLDRERSQVKLVESAKMVAVGRMAAGVAHEVNNPLQLVMSQAEAIKSAVASGNSDLAIAKAEQIQSVAMRIASINKGLLALARDSQRDPFDSVSICDVIKLSLEFCRARFESKNVEIQFGDYAPNVVVRGRETQLAEVVLNMLNNAYDAIEGLERRWVRIDVQLQSRWVEIVISDSGPGIDKAIQPRIFDPFFTTKPAGRGTGLGLSICKSVISEHDGEIFYDASRANSAFVLRLPNMSIVA